MSLARKRQPSGFTFESRKPSDVRKHVVSLLQAWRDAWVWEVGRQRLAIEDAKKELGIEIRASEWEALIALPPKKTGRTKGIYRGPETHPLLAHSRIGSKPGVGGKSDARGNGRRGD